MDLKQYIADIEDFPKPGIIFRDVTPILDDPICMNEVVESLSTFVTESGANKIIAPEARGFFFGIPVAMNCKVGFAPVRKPGKLPRKTISQSYQLEYGEDSLEIHEDAILPGEKVVIVDDLLATGGTVEAMIQMVERMQAKVVGVACVIELDDLKGRDRFPEIPFFSLVHYHGE